MTDITAAVDSAMVEMRNISPPLTRKECERLIRAALGEQSVIVQPQLDLDFISKNLATMAIDWLLIDCKATGAIEAGLAHVINLRLQRLLTMGKGIQATATHINPLEHEQTK